MKKKRHYPVGVHFDPSRATRPWTARLRKKNLGRFETMEAAWGARRTAEAALKATGDALWKRGRGR